MGTPRQATAATARACLSELCGDGIVNNGTEVCDGGINDGTFGSCAPDCSASIP